VNQVEGLILEIDRAWSLAVPGKVELKIIGAAALLLQAGYGGGTKDSDIFETANLTPPIQAHLLELAGSGTTLAKRHRMYVEVVRNGIPFLRQRAIWHPQTALNGQLHRLHVEVLDVVDVAVSKLKRLSPSDEAHIEAMVEAGLLPHHGVVSCFNEAVDAFLGDAREEDLPKYVANLHRIERDTYGVAPTAIELPSRLTDE
jgi:hypothetical protein